MALQLPKNVTTALRREQPSPRPSFRAPSRALTTFISALPMRPRRKATPAERLLALVTRRQPKSAAKSPATRWWADRSQAQRITTIALAASISATLVSATAWAGARAITQRKSARQELPESPAAELEAPETETAKLESIAEMVSAQ